MTTIKCLMNKSNSIVNKEGRIQLDVTWSPTATNKFHLRTAQDFADYLKGTLNRTYVEANDYIDTKNLSVNDGSLNWSILIDVLVLSNEGNTLDAASLAIFLALSSLKIPDSLAEHLGDRILVQRDNIPIYVTCYKVGHSYLVDATREEEASSLASIYMALIKDNSCVNLIQEGCGSLSKESIITMCKMCCKICHLLRENILNIN